MAFAAKIGLDMPSLYEIIRHAAGGSWMFGHVVPAMLKADWTSSPFLEARIKALVCWSFLLDQLKY
jgi:L-threonate 2-dehydrogenase